MVYTETTYTGYFGRIGNAIKGMIFGPILVIVAVGFIVMWTGLGLILSPLAMLANVIGIIGDIVGAGIGIVTFVIAIAGSFITIAVAWIAYRPIVGVGLLAVAVGAIVWFFALRSKGSAQRKGVGNRQAAVG